MPYPQTAHWSTVTWISWWTTLCGFDKISDKATFGSWMQCCAWRLFLPLFIWHIIVRPWSYNLQPKSINKLGKGWGNVIRKFLSWQWSERTLPLPSCAPWWSQERSSKLLWGSVTIIRAFALVAHCDLPLQHLQALGEQSALTHGICEGNPLSSLALPSNNSIFQPCGELSALTLRCNESYFPKTSPFKSSLVLPPTDPLVLWGHLVAGLNDGCSPYPASSPPSPLPITFPSMVSNFSSLSKGLVNIPRIKMFAFSFIF